MLKIFSKPGFSNTWIVNFQMFELDLEKAEEPEIKLPTSAGSLRKQESSRKTSTSALLTKPRPWLCGYQQTVENAERDGNTRPPDLPLEKQVRKPHLELDMEQQTGSKQEKEYVKSVLFNVYAEYIMRNTGLEEAQTGIKIARRNNNNLRYANDTTLMQKVKKN